MKPPQFILEINTRVWLRELGRGAPLALGDVPDRELDKWQQQGFDAIWLCGVWLPSPESRRIASEHPGLRKDYTEALPDWTVDDVGGSPYAIRGYEVDPALGGDEALAGFRARLGLRGLRLILDFISNHTALDHPWVIEHPEYYVSGTEADVVQHPERWFWAQTAQGPRALAHGRDPYFPPWTDTAQLDYHQPDLRARMRAALLRVAGMCDGVRCDMAMLEIASVFEKIWQRRPAEFWPQAIAETRAQHPDFCFIAEVYWELDGVLHEMGFDLTYDKDLLDVVVYSTEMRCARFALPEAEHRRRVRFLENHDEQRIASRLPADRHAAAAAWVLSLPSTRLLYDGQIQGRRKRLPIQLLRAPVETLGTVTHAHYTALLAALRREEVRRGRWLLLNPQPAWTGNGTHHAILGQGYDLDDQHLRIFVNWSSTRSQCWVKLDLGSSAGQQVILRDLVGPKSYGRDGMEVMLRGLYLDLEPWEVHVFECRMVPVSEPVADPRVEPMPSLSELRR